MTYEEYKRGLKAKGDTGTVTGRIVNENPLSAIQFIENSAKTAKIEVNQVKTAKWGSNRGEDGCLEEGTRGPCT